MSHRDVECKQISAGYQQCSSGLEFKTNSSIGKQQPDVCRLVCELVSLYPGN